MKKRIWNIKHVLKAVDAYNFLDDAKANGLIDEEAYEEAINVGLTTGWHFDDWKLVSGLYGKEVIVSPKSLAESVGKKLFIEKK